MFETRNELEGFRWTGKSYVNFSSFLFSVFGFKDGLLDKTGNFNLAGRYQVYSTLSHTNLAGLSFEFLRL